MYLTTPKSKADGANYLFNPSTDKSTRYLSNLIPIRAVNLRRKPLPLTAILLIMCLITVWFFHYSFRAPFNSQKLKENKLHLKRYPNYYEDDLRPHWNFKISKNYNETSLHRWSEPIPRIRTDSWTRGENGQGFNPTNDEEKAEMEKLKSKHNYNLFGSEQISLHRSLPDYRFPECRNLTYPDTMPTTSVVIVFHNEAWSTLLRTVWSIIDRSPRELLEEIILVDDASEWEFLKRPLDDYVERLPIKVRIIRSAKREGLIRARLIGARNATGSVLTFLDGHVECSKGWLEPLLARIASDRSVVAVPNIDMTSTDTMGYYPFHNTQVMALRWNLIFDWISIPKRELERTHYDKTAPIRLASHIGCAFSIDREFFFEVGGYDDGMDIWGSENVEMAFRVWMCGGSLEVLPCSRVGHLFRQSTYSFNGNADTIKAKNNIRLIEVWMDDYKRYFYAANPESRNVLPGDLTKRKELRKRLNCKSFRWYLEHISPESAWLNEFLLMGEVKSMSTHRKCLDVCPTSNEHTKIFMYDCHGAGGNQFFALSKNGQLVTKFQDCIGLVNGNVSRKTCADDDKQELWDYDEKNHWIVQRGTQMCVESNSIDVFLKTCDPNNIEQKWEYNSYKL